MGWLGRILQGLTDSPWVTYLDTTSFNNGSYQLRATAHDSTVSEDIIEITPTFTIANQIPIITQFSVSNIEYGSGISASDRAWFSIATDGILEFSWDASDDDLLQAQHHLPYQCSQGLEHQPTMDHQISTMGGTGRLVP